MMAVAPILLLIVITLARGDQVNHRVKESETLYSLSRHYGIALSQLRLANGLNSSGLIKAGQNLVIPVHFYIVEEGDSLAVIAQKLEVDEKKLVQLNKSIAQPLKAGDFLTIPQKPFQGQYYTVQKGDSLSLISMRFDISQTSIIRYNDLDSPHLAPGQKLQLTGNRPQNYKVQENDTLYSLSRRYNISVDQLIQYNALNGVDIKVGQELLMFSPTYSTFDDEVWQPNSMIKVARSPTVINPVQNRATEPAAKPPTSSTVAKVREPQPFENQPSLTYESYEDEKHTTANYKKAIALLATVASEAMASPLSKKLAGYHIVLDSGHGGNDPGAVVEQKIRGKSMFFIENKYNYDVTLRLYKILKRHGATVSMTNISPDHTIRNNDINHAFINRKTEVANDATKMTRLKGGREALLYRRELVGRLLQGSDPGKSLFLSIHMDSSPDTVLGLVAVGTSPTKESIALATSIIKSNGRGSIVQAPYIMITDNSAIAAVLVEVRNLRQESASTFNDYQVRQDDAQKIADAIINYATNL